MTTPDLSGGSTPPLLEKEKLDDLLEKLPEVTGLRRLPVHYTSFDVQEPWTALGSDIGLVCVYNSQKNRLYQLHEIRHTVTVVKLSLELSCLAYGSQDGVLRMISFDHLVTDPSDALVREAQQHSVTALEWNKYRLFSGFSSGKVLMTTVKLNKGSCATGLLLQTGSHVVQLTSFGNHLLICTMASSYTLHYVNGKLSQIGHQDRKAGPYGACFSTEADTIFVARPGLRLWKAQASTGTVISTSKYREALGLRSIPIIPLLGISPSHPVITDRTQFTLLHLWYGKFVITHHQHALWVLDPSGSSVVATLAERLPIIDITCCKDSVYLLLPDKCPLVKLTLHADFKPLFFSPDKGLSSSNKDISSTLESGMKTEPTNISSSRIRAISLPIVANPAAISSKEVTSLPQQNLSQDIVTTHTTSKYQSDDREVTGKRVAGLTMAEMSVGDRLHKMQSSSLDTESSSIAVQSVLKKKKKKKKKTTSHDVADSPVLSPRDPVLDVNRKSRYPTYVEMDSVAASQHGHAGVDDEDLASHAHSKVDKMPGADKSHTQFTIDDVQTHGTNQKLVTAAAQSDTMSTHIDQKAVNSSNSDIALTHSDQEVVATSKSDTVLTHNDQKTGSSETILTDVAQKKLAHSDQNTSNSEATLTHVDQKNSDMDLAQGDQKTSNNETLLTCVDQKTVATSKSDTILADVVQKMTATSNNDIVMVHSNQDMIATGKSDTIQTDDSIDGNLVSRNQGEMLPVEAVGYHIERLQEDNVMTDDNALQLTSSVEHSKQDDKVNIIIDNASQKGETLTLNQDDNVAEKVENVEKVETIHPFLPEQSITSRQQSIVNSDFTSLFKKCIDDMATRREHRKELFGPVSPQPKETVDNQLKESKEDKLVAASTTDIWSTLPPCPSKLGARRLAAAGKILWVVDSKGTTYWYSLDNVIWNTEKQSMEYISSSSSGLVVWGIYKGQPYVRKGITKKLPQGQSWHKVDHEMVKLITVGESCVWTVNQDDKLMCRQGVSSVCPEGFQWQHTQFKANFAKSITFCDDVLWACDKIGTVYALNTADGLLHAQWETVNGVLLESVSLTKGGIIWGVEQQVGTVFFRCNVTLVSPGGSGPWWEVNTAQPVNQETCFAGALANKVTSVVPDAIATRIDSFSNRFTNSLPVNFIKSTIGSFIDNGDVIKKITTSSQAVWVLDGKGVIRYCRSVVTGSRYVSVSSLELMMVSLWTQISAMSTVPLNQGGLVWALRSTRELFCFDEEGSVMQIEYPPSKIEQVATSITAVWIVTNKGIYARDNVSVLNPKGTGWTKVDMGVQNIDTVSWLSCGKRVVWLVDSSGTVLMRFGVESTGEASLALAWIEVDSSHTMTQVMVGTEDWLVWACDTHCNVYVRSGITDTFPIGDKWELVPGCKAINLCCSGNFVWALCPGGELLCRFGIKQDNVMGDYWKCLTGRFCHISATLCGQLWVINEKGRLHKRLTHLLSISESKSQASSLEMKNVEEWDIV